MAARLRSGKRIAELVLRSTQSAGRAKPVADEASIGGARQRNYRLVTEQTSVFGASDFALHRHRPIALLDDFKSESFIKAHRRIIRRGTDRDRATLRIRLHQLREECGANATFAVPGRHREAELPNGLVRALVWR